MKCFKAKGANASSLRQRKYELIRRYQIPENILGGSLCLTYRRCGKPNCHCASGKGHPIWSLTFMHEGKKHVERIPEDWVAEVRSLLEQGRKLKKAVAEVSALNAQLLVLQRQQTKKGKR